MDLIKTALSGIGSFLAGIKVYLIIGAGILAAIGLAYWYFQWSQSKMDALELKITALQIKAETLETTNKTLVSDMSTVKALTDQFNKDLNNIKLSSTRVINIVRSQDFKNQAASAPAAAQKTLNDNVNSLFKDVNDASRN